MTSRPWVRAESTWAAVRAADCKVAILPWGATEAHDRHLPCATDTMQAEQVAIALASDRRGTRARRAGVRRG